MQHSSSARSAKVHLRNALGLAASLPHGMILTMPTAADSARGTPGDPVRRSPMMVGNRPMFRIQLQLVLGVVGFAMSSGVYAQISPACPCIDECRARLFAVDPRRAQCVSACATNIAQCRAINGVDGGARRAVTPARDSAQPSPRRAPSQARQMAPRERAAIPPSVRTAASEMPPRVRQAKPRMPQPRPVEVRRAPKELRLARSAKPSFDCRYARGSVERAICANPELATKDRRMALMYERAGGSRHQPVDPQQWRWLSARNACARSRAVEPCIAQVYDERIAELASIQR